MLIILSLPGITAATLNFGPSCSFGGMELDQVNLICFYRRVLTMILDARRLCIATTTWTRLWLQLERLYGYRAIDQNFDFLAYRVELGANIW